MLDHQRLAVKPPDFSDTELSIDTGSVDFGVGEIDLNRQIGVGIVGNVVGLTSTGRLVGRQFGGVEVIAVVGLDASRDLRTLPGRLRDVAAVILADLVSLPIDKMFLCSMSAQSRSGTPLCMRTSALSGLRDRGVETCSRKTPSVVGTAGAGRSRRGGAEEGAGGGTSGAELAGSAAMPCAGAVSRLTAAAGGPAGGDPRSTLGAICAGGDRPLVARKTRATMPSEAADKIARCFQRRSIFASRTSGNGGGPPPRWSSRSASSMNEIGSSPQNSSSASGALSNGPVSGCSSGISVRKNGLGIAASASMAGDDGGRRRPGRDFSTGVRQTAATPIPDPQLRNSVPADYGSSPAARCGPAPAGMSDRRAHSEGGSPAMIA